MQLKQTAVLWLLQGILNSPKAIREKIVAGGNWEIENQTLDEKLQILLTLSKRMPNKEDFEPVVARREGIADLLVKEFHGQLDIRDRVITALQKAVPVRIYSPAKQKQSPAAILFFHGGGFVVGSRDTHDTFCRHLCESVHCKVISVEYRLAPENPFPAAVDDALAAYQWLVDSHEELHMKDPKIIVAGDSAGANLAAVLCQQAKLREMRQPDLQCLIYPSTDLRCIARSHQTFAEGFGLTEPLINWFVNHYVPNFKEREIPLASPLLCKDFSKLAPAIITIAGFDPLRDEGRDYGDKLRNAGVPTTMLEHPTLCHGYINLTRVIPAADEATEQLFSQLRQAIN